MVLEVLAMYNEPVISIQKVNIVIEVIRLIKLLIFTLSESRDSSNAQISGWFMFTSTFS